MSNDPTATTDQVRAAEKRAAAAKVAAEDAKAYRDQGNPDVPEAAERSAPPKGRSSAPKSKA